MEVWLRNKPLTLDPLRHLLLCTLQQAEEDIVEQTSGLGEEDLWRNPHGLTSAGFHIRHIAESLDRLLTYAESQPLSPGQFAILDRETTEQLPLLTLIVLLKQRLTEGRARIAVLNSPQTELRHIGRSRIPVPLGALLAHIAEHTQRHLGQLTVTLRVLRS
ncbi:MAG: DinB family protein [Acidobacteriota bacterium]